MTKTQALAIARRAHSKVAGGFASGYQFQHPAQLGQPNGKAVTFSCSDYNAARKARTLMVAQCALVLMGWPRHEAARAAADLASDAVGSLGPEAIVSAALAAKGEQA